MASRVKVSSSVCDIAPKSANGQRDQRQIQMRSRETELKRVQYLATRALMEEWGWKMQSGIEPSFEMSVASHPFIDSNELC